MGDDVNRNNPFRAANASSIDASVPGQGPGTSAPASSTGQGRASFFSCLSPRGKVLFGAIVAVVFTVVYYRVLSLVNDTETPFVRARISEEVKVIAKGESRSVDDAWRKAGFFHRVFCRGAQRSRFCDEG